MVGGGVNVGCAGVGVQVAVGEGVGVHVITLMMALSSWLFAELSSGQLWIARIRQFPGVHVLQ